METSSKKAIYAALIGNLLIAVTKFIAAIVTGSSAMLSEGIHSVVDTGNQILLLFGLHRAKQPPDDQFPFGHGKEVYFWSFVVALLIFAVGSGISLYEGIVHLRHPHPVDNPTLNYIVIGFAFLFEGTSWTIAVREFSKTKGSRSYLEAVHRGKDPSAFVVMFEDSAAMLGLICAALGILLSQVTGNPIFDGSASICIGLILGGTAIWLAFETKGLLIGESANTEVVQGVKRLAQAYPEINAVNEVLTMHMGPDFILVNLSVDFIDTITAEKVEKVIARLDKQMKSQFPRVKRIFIEAEDRNISGIKP